MIENIPTSDIVVKESRRDYVYAGKPNANESFRTPYDLIGLIATRPTPANWFS